MDNQRCPVCKGAATLSTRTFSDPVTVVPMPLSVSCDMCGAFKAEEGFFPHVWDTIPAEDKHAIAAYLKKTKGRPDGERKLSSGSWKHLASRGKKMC